MLKLSEMVDARTIRAVRMSFMTRWEWLQNEYLQDELVSRQEVLLKQAELIYAAEQLGEVPANLGMVLSKED